MTTDPAPISPDLQALFANSGLDLNSLLMGPGASSAPTQQLSLPELLLGSAMDVSGRYGMTGRDFRGTLPPWAQNLGPSVMGNPDFDPYLGIVSQQGDERVYMGQRQYKKTTYTPSSTPANKFESDVAPVEHMDTTVTKKPGDRTLTATAAMNLPYTWDETEVADAIKRMRDSGIQVSSFDDLVQAWGGLVQRASMTYAMSEGKRKVTPWDVLDMYKSEQQAAGTWVDPNRTVTSTAKKVTDITEGQAWQSLQGTLSQMLGRDPSDQELRDFTYRMNQLAARNPAISKTITQFKDGRPTSRSQESDPGFTGADIVHEAYDQAQSDPGYAEYRSGAYYFNALMGALGPIGG